jgi:hypothetical protein
LVQLFSREHGVGLHQLVEIKVGALAADRLGPEGFGEMWGNKNLLEALACFGQIFFGIMV